MSDQTPQKPVGRWLRRIRYAALSTVIVLPLIIFFQNLDTSATVQLLFWQPDMPVMLLLAIAFVGGGTAGLLAGLALRRGKGK